MARRRKFSSGSFAGESLVPFLDQAMLLGAFCLSILMVSLPYVNEPPKGEEEKRAETTPTALYVQVEWDKGTPHDIDTYLECDIYLTGKRVRSSVNYRQKNSNFLDLIVDDLGGPSPDNYERVLTNSMLERMLPNTTCRLNAHLYSTHGGALPVNGTFDVILNKDHAEGELQLTPEEGQPFSIMFGGQEVTLMELVLNEQGEVIREVTSFYPDTIQSCLAACPAPQP